MFFYFIMYYFQRTRGAGHHPPRSLENLSNDTSVRCHLSDGREEVLQEEEVKAYFDFSSPMTFSYLTIMASSSK